MDLAVSSWETMELRRSPVGGQRLATGGEACRQDSLLVGDSRAGNPVERRVFRGLVKIRSLPAVAKWRAGFRVSLVRTPALPRSRREEVGSLARVYARFAPNFGRGPEARRVRQTSPPDAGRNPVAGRKWINSGRKRAVYNLGGPPL